MDFYVIGKHTRTAVNVKYDSKRYLYLNLGSLADHIIESVLDLRMIILRSKFSLVHVAAPKNNVAVGILKHISQSLLTKDVFLAFTFVVNGEVNNNDIPSLLGEPVFEHRFRRHIRMWEGTWIVKDNYTGNRFITLLYRDLEVNKINLGLTPTLDKNLLTHLYETIGVITDNLLRYKAQYSNTQKLNDNMDQYYRNMTLKQMSERGDLALNVVMRTRPFWVWPLSKEVHASHPNLISDKFWSQWTVYYYIAYIHQRVKHHILSNRNLMRRIVSSKHGVFGSGRIIDILLDSVRSMENTYIPTVTYNDITENKGASYNLGKFDTEMDDHSLRQEIYKRLYEK